MLETIRITNYALIDSVELEFDAGFNVLTGETGAGKSIIVGALGLILGARASSDAVRQGTKRATVEAVFRLPHVSPRLQAIFEDHDIELEDESLLISRIVYPEGRSKAYVGGQLAPLAVLSAIGDELVDLHGQHEHQSLMRGDRQLDLVDAYAKLHDARDALRDEVRALREIEHAIEKLESDDRDRSRHLEFLKFELEEIRKANLDPGEEEDLKQRQRTIAHAEGIVNAAAQAYSLLYDRDNDSAIAQVDEASRALEKMADADPALGELAKQLDAARETLANVAEEVREFTELPEFDPAELDHVQQRLETIRGLKRKFGDSIELILAYADKAEAEIDTFENRDAALAELQAKQKRAMDEVMSRAKALRKKRVAAAKKLQQQAEPALQALGMKGARFEATISEEGLSESGIDRARFQLAANAGEKMGSLKSVASGGEVSRVMLALKATFAEADAIPTLIFDEIDTGVGGAVANEVAAKLASLAESHQVICITHLPQLAAAGDAHFCVAKETSDGRTHTSVDRIDAEQRIEELARLLDGSVSAVSLEHARSLLDAR